jgi:hypothetical protein
VSITNATFPGVRFAATGPSRVVGIPSKGAAARLTVQQLFDRRR